jgi:hypothetical protein
MSCPYCGASNPRLGKSTVNDYDIMVMLTPVVLHYDCRGRVINGIAQCDDCPSRFACLTGNIDDGTETKNIKPANTTIKEVKAREYNERCLTIRRVAKRRGLVFYSKGMSWYAHHKSTTYKLGIGNDKEFKAVYYNLWNTPKTKKLARAFMKDKIHTTTATILFRYEIGAAE